MKISVRRSWWRSVSIAACVAATAAALGDTAADKKREMLKGVRTVAVVAPIFGIGTLERAERTSEPEKADASDAAKAARGLRQYGAMLRGLQAYAARTLPERVRARTGLTTLSGDAVAKAMEAERLAPTDLFKLGGVIRAGKFPPPDPLAVKRLANRLHADAVLLVVLDEPRRSSQQYFYDDPFYGLLMDNIRFVTAKGAVYLDLANGDEALHAYVEKLQPRTTVKGRDFLLADWKDAEGLLIEDTMDEITRYTPPR